MFFDISRSGNPRVSSSLDFDVRAGIKADGFDFYAIKCKPYGLPINRPHPLNSPLSRLFPFESMRSEGLRLDLSFFLSRCVPMNSKNSKLPYFPFNLFQRLSLSSNFKIKKHRLKCFYGCALMNKVQLLKNSSPGRNYLSP